MAAEFRLLICWHGSGHLNTGCNDFDSPEPGVTSMEIISIMDVEHRSKAPHKLERAKRKQLAQGSLKEIHVATI